LKNQKSRNGIIALLIVIIIILLVLLVLSLTGTLSFNRTINNKEQMTESTNNVTTSNENTTEKSSTNIFDTIDVNKLDYNGKDISDGEVEKIYINGIESDNSGYYNISMTLSGKVKVSLTSETGNYSSEYLSNIDDTIDIVEFSVPGVPSEQLIYILLANGDVYYYKVGDSITKNYTATKVDSVSKVKRLFIYNYGKANAGGSWDLVAVTVDNKCVTLNSETV
jgi:hypothetical protein